MFTEKDGTSFKSEERKEFYVRQNAKIYSIFVTFKELQEK